MPIRSMELDHAAAKTLRGFQFLSAKPLLAGHQPRRGEHQFGSRHGRPDPTRRDAGPAGHVEAVAVCAKIELEIAQLDPIDAQAFLEDLGLDAPGLHRVVQAAYGLLGYISFFTVGEDECRAWSIPANIRAQQAAGEIHTDIERGFIRAEVVEYGQLLERGTIAACRDHGEVRLEGKDYIVKDGDVINFRFAT